jgi:16S rRNA (cytosine967-C5)-methyltransferase
MPNANKKMSNGARAVAVTALNRFDPKRNYAGPILAELLPQTQERQRVTDLVFGTIRNRSAIDRVIATFSGRPVERIPAKLLNIIRVGVFELIYVPAAPEYSIVNEAVKSAKLLGSEKQTGFANAVLRQITRHIINRNAELSQVDLATTLPQTPVSCCEFDSKFLPDPDTSPADYLAAAFSLPKWLISDWLGEYGLEKTRQICFASNRRPSIYLRPNTLKITAQKLAEHLRRQANIDNEIVPQVEMIKIRSPQDITQLAGFELGLFTVQDITASQAVRLLQPQPNWTILDLCAAPGTKTTQLAELTGDSAKIVATDIDGLRLEKVKENIARLDIKSVTTVVYDEVFENSQFKILNSKFDAVLLDVPCSNTGVLARRVESRYRLRQNTIAELAETQAELLQKAPALVKPGGRICYSTCSIQKAENTDLLRNFLQQNQDFELLCEQIWLPSVEGFDHDGGYVAILSKNF